MVSETENMNGHNGTSGQKLIHTLKEIDANSFSDDGERTQAVLAAYALVARLETPWEFLARFCMGQVHVH
jgi:hypothetical protein